MEYRKRKNSFSSVVLEYRKRRSSSFFVERERQMKKKIDVKGTEGWGGRNFFEDENQKKNCLETV